MLGKLYKVGIYNQKFNDILNISLPTKEIMQSEGLIKHLMKHGHERCIKYMRKIPEIITSPDFIGCNPSVADSIELVKRYEINILLAVELNKNSKYLYVSSLYDVSEVKIQHRLESGRLKIFK